MNIEKSLENLLTKEEYDVQIHFVDISKKKRFYRIAKRNQEKGVIFEFEVSNEDIEFMVDWFEKPAAPELQHGIIIKK